MALVTWNEDLSVNVAQIDLQHKELINMINDLHEAMKQRRAKDVLRKIIDGLINYTAKHFKLEEDYFAQFDYPETAHHKREHAAFVQKVTEFSVDFENGKKSLTIEVMKFLGDWMQKHIKGTDQKYTQFFNAKGLK